jgi:hypothetical protein
MRQQLRVFVEVSDKYLWTLQPFSYLFNLYWSELQPVIVAGYSRPDFKLPKNFTYHSIDKVNYPAEKWTDGMIKFLRSYDDEHFVFLLCDYWLCRTVDLRGVQACYQYVKDRPNVLRIDLTDDRQYAGGMFDVEAWGNYDIIETPHGTPYQMSTQAGIWNRRLLLSLLRPNVSPWNTEMYTSPPPDMRVLGTRQRPVRYANALLKGNLDVYEISKIVHPHRQYVSRFIPEEFKKK